MPARASAAINDTQDNRLGVALQRGFEEDVYEGRAQTVGAVSANILFDSLTNPSVSGQGGSKFRIPQGTTVHFRGLVTCANATDDPATALNYGNAFSFEGVIRNLNGTTAVPAAGITVTTLDATASQVFTSANCLVTADDTNDTLQIAVLGIAGKTYNWKCKLIVNAISFFG